MTSSEEMGRVGRASLVVARVLAAMALVVVGVFAWTGGVRIRTPIGAMNAELDRLDMPGARLVAADERGERLCFIQCEEWAVIRYYALDDRPAADDLEQLCAQLNAAVTRWSDGLLTGGVATSAEQREFYLCGYAGRGVSGHDDWCTEADVLPLDDARAPGADIRVLVGIEC